MRRIIVLGGFGFFGGAAVERLRAEGLAPLIGSRRAAADVRVDVEDPASLRAALRRDDVVLDAVGPFQDRTTALIDAAVEIGADVVDLSDSLDYAARVVARSSRIADAGIRVLTSCSSVSAISAACVRLSGIARPERVAVWLAPATRHTANSGVMESLLRSLAAPVRMLRDGRLVARRAWSESREFPMPPPVGPIRGHLLGSADSLLLPMAWASLRRVDFYVDARTPIANAALALAARIPAARRLLATHYRRALVVARRLGATSGGLGIEVRGDGATARFALAASSGSYTSAVTPAVLAARAIAEDRFDGRGVVTPDRYVDPRLLVERFASAGISLTRLP